MAKILLPLQNFFPDKEVNVPVVTARCVSGALQEVCTHDLMLTLGDLGQIGLLSRSRFLSSQK